MYNAARITVRTSGRRARNSLPFGSLLTTRTAKAAEYLKVERCLADLRRGHFHIHRSSGGSGYECFPSVPCAFSADFGSYFRISAEP